MPEFKFSCPNCGQHIVCDVGCVGMSINCPSCQKFITIPSASQNVGTPPPPPTTASPILGTRQTTAVPSAGQRFPGAGAPPPKKSSTLKMVLGITGALVGAAIGFFSVQFTLHHLGAGKPKGNPAATVSAPTTAATVQALSLLSKMHAAYTNLASVTADGTVTLFLDLSNLTVADVNPNMPANASNAKRHPAGMPRLVTNTTEFSVKRAPTNWFYIAGEAVSKVDRLNLTNTFAIWSAGKGMFLFTDSHQGKTSTRYMQLPDANPANSATEQVRNLQHLFEDPAQLTKIIKNLGQTEDESVNGQECYTLTAKVFGQKVKIWVDKTSCLVSQWQVTLGGAISDADVDDAFSLFAAGFTNMPPQQLEMVKAQLKQFTPAIAKIRGTITSTTKNLEVNPTLTADDFNYSVPEDVQLIRMPGAKN